MIFKQFRKILVGKFSIQKFSHNKTFYTCRKQCSSPGKASENAYSGLWGAITIKIHVFLLKNQGKSLIFHGFPCQNFFWTAAMLTTVSGGFQVPTAQNMRCIPQTPRKRCSYCHLGRAVVSAIWENGSMRNVHNTQATTHF